MPYKDKEKQKETTLERVRRYREKQKGVTSEGVTTKGVTEKTPQERAREILPAERFKLVEHLVKKYNEPERYERAISYREWELGKVEDIPHIVSVLTEPKSRRMLEYLSLEFNRKGLADNVWYGVGGPDFETVGELLEVTR